MRAVILLLGVTAAYGLQLPAGMLHSTTSSVRAAARGPAPVMQFGFGGDKKATKAKEEDAP
eukprot:1845667-Prymnesium_polylepis.1